MTLKSSTVVQKIISEARIWSQLYQNPLSYRSLSDKWLVRAYLMAAKAADELAIFTPADRPAFRAYGWIEHILVRVYKIKQKDNRFNRDYWQKTGREVLDLMYRYKMVEKIGTANLPDGNYIRRLLGYYSHIVLYRWSFDYLFHIAAAPLVRSGIIQHPIDVAVDPTIEQMLVEKVEEIKRNRLEDPIQLVLESEHPPHTRKDAR